MYEKESLVPKDGAVIRECIIPTESIRLLNISLNEDENGLQYAFSSSSVYLEKTTSNNLPENILNNVEILPITLRKHLLYQDLEAS